MSKKNKIFIFLFFLLFDCVSITLAQLGSIKWKFKTHYKINSPPAIGKDSTIYRKSIAMGFIITTEEAG